MLTSHGLLTPSSSADDKSLKTLTVGEYHDQLQKRYRNQNPNLVYVWKFHGENKPCKVLSIRAIDVNLSRQPLKFGSRLAIQACVKFDTMQVSASSQVAWGRTDSHQSLEVFTKKGDRVAGDGTPKRVVEYLVLQKRMWYDAPWTIREQLYEELEGQYRLNQTAAQRVRIG
ncbi:uncharacterized protein PHACADRAFT_251962 [Phanerochaete carnosa HHB-10118-sp]|uniref:Tim44-like domain-containing protein n=1 Tax=Phanerochaete carnosa (strain HHB-10118-sp) TaxID=650164 RepID=K5W2C6_PHACS|nr:uncharacterized protein PHACADRAFT_251962 [Phanerochaete carnosa HHB-10118-sp]EKM58008.1 hypothetical protein PHACADRAFT_251962 [Phanerochaete carnosa HHB-10118-sp]